LIRENPDDKEFISTIKQSYNEFEHNFPDISEKEVKMHPELKPVYDIKPFKEKLKKELNDFLEAPSKTKECTVKQEIQTIIGLGNMYHNSLISHVRKVRESEPDYTLEIIDSKGRKFHYK